MSRTYTTTGIILKRRDYLENDRLFCIYTKDYGKLDILAKGTKKITSKLNPYLEPLYFIKVMVAKGKAFDRLANCDLIRPYQNLRHDIYGFYLLNYLAEVTDNFIIGQTFSDNKFDLLLETLNILDQQINITSHEKLLMLANIYCFKLLNLLGYRPEIQRCVICHKGILLTKNIFDFTNGGLICEDCKNVCLIEDYLKISDKAIKLLQLAEVKSLKELIDLEGAPEELQEFNNIIYRLVLINTEKPLKSYEFISQLKQMPAQ